ncbi:MAG: DUF885 family protein [Propionibacteriales bacterium]|nr:DUF885 family protein [Propionibacteriales bacterium]
MKNDDHTQPDPTPHAAAARPVDALADRFVEDYSALAPIDATFAGIAGHDDEMNDYTPDGFAAREELVRRALAALDTTTPTDPREAVAKDAMAERLGLDVERYDARIPQTELNVIDSPMQDIRMVFDLMDTEGEEAWANIASRLEAVPDSLRGYQQTLREGAASGHVTSRRQVDSCAAKVDSWTDDSGSGDFFAGLVSQGPDDGALRGRLEAAADAARTAYRDFARFLRGELSGPAREHDPVGRDRYALGSRYFLGATIDLDETYAWGWEELKRIEDEMAAVADRIVPGGSVDDAVAALDADPARRIEGTEAFRDWMQALADKTVAELADVHFDIPEAVRRIECRIAPTHEGGIYYTGPSEDFSRPGRMWWAVPEGTTSFATWQEVTTVFHEGVPGHHLQIGQTAYRSDLLNRWQRLMCFVSGHGEGWALYAERLMEELGYLDDPGELLGMLDGQALRAVRVIIDIGMHLELAIPTDNPFGFHPGETWTPDLGFAFLLQHCRMDEQILRFEFDRYLGWPGQAPSYKVGERIWLRAREEAQARKGAGFELKEFHRAALDLGPLGLDPLRDALRRM